MDYLDSLNPAQREAVTHTTGPLLVLAGAGAGKTRVIAHRILHIILSGEEPERVLAITFTNKAAREMRERVRELLAHAGRAGGPAPFVSTFHSLALSIIKENYRAVGLKGFPAIYDRSDSLKAMKAALKESGAGEEVEPRAALGMISRAKGDGLAQREYEEGADGPREKAAARAWRFYEKRLAEDGALDFDDLLARATALLREREDVREGYRRRWRYLHIDEYQDTNRIQNELADLLVGEERNVCAVGDIDQTIYSWRGADIQNLLQFEKRYPGAKVVVLEENYRSTKTILVAANAVIARNVYRIEKNLFTRRGDGEPILLYQALNESDEASHVAHAVRDLMAGGRRPREVAVLYRANFQSRALEEALLNENIPYQVIGTRFFERAEVKDILSFIRAALFDTQADIARIANTPPRGIGKTTLLALLSGKEAALPPRARESISKLRDILRSIALAAEKLPPSALVSHAARESGIEKELRDDKLEGAERLENVRELAALASRFDALPPKEGVQALLESAALASDQDEIKDESDAVRLMTVHASKGLEFPYVFITGLEEGLFPYESDDMRDAEEERRLMYVALTRGKERVYLSFAAMRTVFGSQAFSEPSQFLADLPPETVELEGPERLGRTIYLE